MIYNNKAELEKLAKTYPNLFKAIEFMDSFSLENAMDGHIEIDGAAVYANVDSYTTRIYDNTRYESHRKYIDIQFMLHGAEEIEVADCDALEPAGAYDDEHDVVFYQPKPAVRFRITDGEFLVLLPEDGHRPGIAPGNIPTGVQKMVIKVAKGE